MRYIGLKEILVLIFLFLGKESMAQNYFHEGSIVKNSQDTIFGYIKMKGSIQDPTFIFKSSAQSDMEEKLMANDVKSVIIKDYRYFKTIQIDSELRFAQALVDGYASLLLRDKTFYLLKDDKLNPLEIENIEVESKTKVNPIHKKKTYIGVLKSSMSDCPSIWSTIDRTRLEENGLTKVVDSYNKCVNQSSNIFKKDIPLFKVNISGLIALNYVPLRVEVLDQFNGVLGYLEEANFTSVSFSPGIGINLSSPRIDDRFSFYTELRYVRNSFSDNVYYPSSTYDQNDVSIKASYIYFPISFKYNIPFSEAANVFIKGGLLKTFLIDSEYNNFRSNTSVPGVPPTNDKDRFDFYSTQTGYLLSIGYQRKLTEKLDGGVELRYENTGPIINSATVSFIQDVFSLHTFISFK